MLAMYEAKNHGGHIYGSGVPFYTRSIDVPSIRFRHLQILIFNTSYDKKRSFPKGRLKSI